MVTEKVKFENETKKLTEKLEKVTEKEAKQKEQNKRLEADIEKEVQKRVQSVVDQKDKAAKDAANLVEKYDKLNHNMDKLKK